MMETGAVRRQRQKAVAIALSPAQNILHRVHAVAMDIVLQNNGYPVVLNAVNHIFCHTFGFLRFSGVSRVDVPVKILEARILHGLRQEAHDSLTALLAYQIGAATGKAHQCGRNPGVVVNDGLHF